jgi:signal transduction histidine kinase
LVNGHDSSFPKSDAPTCFVLARQLIKTANSHHASLLHCVNYLVVKLIVNTRTQFLEEFLNPEDEESRFMFLPDTMLIATSDVRLIVLSILVAVIGSYTALDISEQIILAQGAARWWWLVGSGLTLGLSVWAMHFTAILAHKLPIPIGYDFTRVLISLMVTILASGIGLFFVSHQPLVMWLPLLAGSFFVGGGIIGMHFTAMSSLRLAATPSYDLELAVLSGVIAIALSLGALWLTFQCRIESSMPEAVRKLGSALIMGTAIFGMHYVAMLGVSFRTTRLTLSKFSVVDNNLLAVVLGVAALVILTLALLASFFSRRLSVEVAVTEVLLQNEEHLEQLVNQRTAELEAQKLISEGANQAKTEFLSTVSHELRTPLTSIIGFSSVLKKEIFGSLNAKQQEYVTVILACGDQLLDLINDLLDLSKIEAGREELDLETLCVEQVCQECVSLIRQQSISKRLQLLVAIEPNVTTCTADKRRLKQILLNLLSNALKFTDVGSVTLKVDKKSGYIRFAVSDTGIGIAQEEQAILFQPFQQLNSGMNRQDKGTGLGLALARNLAQLHGGDITVESELGSGSCFTLLLPVSQSEKAEKE